MRGISYFYDPQKIDLPDEPSPENAITVLEEYAKLDSNSFVAGSLVLKHIRGEHTTKDDDKILQILEQGVEDGTIIKSGGMAAGCVNLPLYKLASS